MIIRSLLLCLCLSFSLSGCIIVAKGDVKRSDDGKRAMATPEQGIAAVSELEAHSDIYVIEKSSKPFAETLADLTAAIDARPFTVFATVDHAAGAERVGKSLPPTTLIIFGNPQGGTPLMQQSRYLGMELPLKAMVWEDDGEVYVAMTHIRHLAGAFDLAGVDDVVSKIETTLNEIMSEATE